MKKLLKILIIAISLIFVFSLAMIIFEGCQGQKDIENFEEVFLLATAPSENKNNNSQSIEEITDKKASIPEIDITNLKKENSDCVAWIYIEGTNINYPVMHTPDEKEKYLYKNFYGNKSKSGTPFIDSRCSLDSDNVIIYAHNMLNGTMFADLKKYLDKSFYNSHNEVLFYTEEGMKSYKIFAIVKTRLDDNWYSFINNADNSLIEEIKNKSVYNTKVTVNTDSKFLTLSTCYGKEDEGRLIVLAVEIS